MAVTINSNGIITGIAVGGLPDGVVDAGTLATNSVDSAELIDGAVDNSHLATGVDAAKVTTGTLPMARLSGTLPALNGSALTNLPAATSVAFPATQSASANANTLDDYEEGSWTPVLGGSGGTSGQSYGTRQGIYTKIGRVVHCSGYINLSTKGTITSTLQVQGFPFTAGSGAGFNSAGSLITINAWTIAAGTIVQFGMTNNTTTANFRSYLGTGSSADGANMATANVNNGTHISFHITYQV